MNRWWKPILCVLRGGHAPPCRADLWAQQRGAVRQAAWLVRAFYAGNLFWAGLLVSEHTRWNGYDALVPLWPLFWAEGMDPQLVASLVLGANALSASAAAIFPASAAARWLALVGVLEAIAFENSFGKVGHAGHAWVWTALFFALLPSAPLRDPEGDGTPHVLRQRFLQTFWMASFAMLLFYAMSGWLKLVSVPVQLARGEVCALAPEALARHIANRAMQTHSEPMLGRVLIEHVWLSWPMYLGAVYLEAFSILIAFRPAVQRLWGSGLILMHLGIGLGMEIWFVPPMFLLAILLVNSPFHRPGTTWREILWQLPGIDLVGLIVRRGRP